MVQVTNERKIFAKLIKQDLNSKIPQLINISEGGGLGLSQIYCLPRTPMVQLQIL